jgi:hypothetical protein
MRTDRRQFLGMSMFAGVGAAQTPPTPGPRGAPPVPTCTAKVTRLWKAPDIHPNALEAAKDGLWIGDQVSERVFKVDWETGKLLQEFQLESHNTSGLAIGAGSSG